MSRRLVLVVIGIAVTCFVSTPAAAAPPRHLAGSVAAESKVPVLAFYYIWFDPGSWDRVKIDYPQVGRYSSDDPDVIREQIKSAQSAGIDGFIVSWKSTPTNNRRLQLLMKIAGEEQFSLAMIYQGLDFSRQPLSVDRVAADFALFRDTYADDPVFLRIGGKPLTIFSGTWAFEHNAVSSITAPVRDSLLVLSTEKSVQGYQRLADVTDGDAYYWSSVDPDTHPSYPDKLNAMGAAIHADANLWIAPFSPGFDARLVGGSKTVDRKDGDTLITQYRAAEQSAPDALGLISWNEFSENTYVEPSVKFGDQYLQVLRQLLTAEPPIASAAEADMGDSSSSAPGTGTEFAWNLALLGVFLVGLFVVVGLIGWRHRRRNTRRTGNFPEGEMRTDKAEALR
jgi:hypothetical protein